jgi:thiol-disulfide isomerase/thioredoxin
MKKAIALSLLVMVLAISACTTPNNGNGNGNGTCEIITIRDGMVLEDSDCAARQIKDKVVIFHAPGCPACSVAVPRLEELEQEMDVEFEFIDVSNGRERMFEIGLIPEKIPTVIINCKVYVGAKSKEEYRSLIEG